MFGCVWPFCGAGVKRGRILVLETSLIWSKNRESMFSLYFTQYTLRGFQFTVKTMDYELAFSLNYIATGSVLWMRSGTGYEKIYEKWQVKLNWEKYLLVWTGKGPFNGIVCTPLCWRGGGRWVSSDQIFKKGGLDRISIFRGRLLGNRWGWLFSGGCSLHKK